MGTIINVTNKDVYIKEKAIYYKISKKLFPFKPEIGYQIKVLKTYDNRVIKIILISKYGQDINKLRSSRFLKVTGFYNIIIGSFLLLLISEKNPVAHDYFSSIFLLIISILITGILIVTVKRPKPKFVFAVFSTIFYALIVIVAIVLFFTNREESFYILIVISIIPLVFNMLYFIFKKKEENPIVRTFPDIY